MTNPTMPQGFDPMARFDVMIADLQRAAEGATAVGRDIEELSVTVWAPERALSVTVDGQGQLSSVHLTDQAMRLSADELSETVLRTVREAYASLRARVGEIVALHPAGGTMQAIAASYEQLVAEPTSHLRRDDGISWA